MMPRRDATGPQGMGPLTGRGMGSCKGEARLAGYGYGRGNGRGNGRGFNQRSGKGLGFGYRNYQPTKDDLKLEKDDLERRLNDINELLEK